MTTEAEKLAAFHALTPEQIAHERLCVLEAAVMAIIATHPDQARVRRIFDAAIARHEVSRVQAGAPPATAHVMDSRTEMLFNGVASG